MFPAVVHAGTCTCLQNYTVCKTQQDKLTYRKGLKRKDKLRKAHIKIYFSKGQINSQGCMPLIY